MLGLRTALCAHLSEIARLSIHYHYIKTASLNLHVSELFWITQTHTETHTHTFSSKSVKKRDITVFNCQKFGFLLEKYVIKFSKGQRTYSQMFIKLGEQTEYNGF